MSFEDKTSETQSQAHKLYLGYICDDIHKLSIYTHIKTNISNVVGSLSLRSYITSLIICRIHVHRFKYFPGYKPSLLVRKTVETYHNYEVIRLPCLLPPGSLIHSSIL
jgi:hypothetical protein